MTGSSERSPAVHRRRIGWGQAAWIAILLAIGSVQLVREQWFDAAVFLVVAGLLGAAALFRGTSNAADAPRPRRAAPARWTAGVLLAVGAAAIASPRHGLLMQILVCAVGLAVLVLAWPQRAPAGRAWARGPARLARAWALILIAGCLWELGAFVGGRLHPERPAVALSDLLDPFLSGRSGQAVFVVLWVAGGWFLISRARR